MLVVVDEPAGGDVTVGMIGMTGVAPTRGGTVIVGTVAAELTPRLPISVDPSGSPVRAAPPGVVGDVGVEDEITLLDPEPHIPDMPEVCSMPDVVDIPDVADIPDDDANDVAEAIVPDVAAVAGAAVPIVVPPPSNVEVDPNIPDGAVPMVEQIVPSLGIEMVPVTVPVGAGLTPGDAISVEPKGMPVGETEPADVPSGEVALIVGVGLAIPLTCALATLQTISAASVIAINGSFIGVFRLQTGVWSARSIIAATGSLITRLSGIA